MNATRSGSPLTILSLGWVGGVMDIHLQASRLQLVYCPCCIWFFTDIDCIDPGVSAFIVKAARCVLLRKGISRTTGNQEQTRDYKQVQREKTLVFIVSLQILNWCGSKRLVIGAESHKLSGFITQPGILEIISPMRYQLIADSSRESHQQGYLASKIKKWLANKILKIMINSRHYPPLFPLIIRFFCHCDAKSV